MNFYAAPSTGNGDTLLTVTGAVFLANPEVKVGIAGAATPLKMGDQIVLIESGSPLAGTRANNVARGTGMQGVTLDYTFDLMQATPTQLLAIVSGTPVANEASRNLSEGYLSGPALLAQSTDFFLTKGARAVRDALRVAAERPEIFAAIGGGRIRNKTGSSVAVKGRNLITGLAAGRNLDTGRLTAAAFFEYGYGDYGSYNSVTGGEVEGKGHTKYQGLGVLAEFEAATGLVIEASLRGGRVETDYRSDDLWDPFTGIRARYKVKSEYLSAHIGVGKTFTLSEAGRLETYAKGIWTRQAGDTARLSTGETLEFDAIDSKRLRIGARFSYTASSSVKGYAGIAADHEFGGEARARTQDRRIDAPRLRGTTGIAELGLIVTPSPAKPFLIDFGLQGYAGRREGVTGSLRAQYYF
jgi:hypothetical protein